MCTRILIVFSGGQRQREICAGKNARRNFLAKFIDTRWRLSAWVHWGTANAGLRPHQSCLYKSVAANSAPTRTKFPLNWYVV